MHYAYFLKKVRKLHAQNKLFNLLWEVVRLFYLNIAAPLIVFYYRFLNSGKKFKFCGKDYYYFYSRYSATWIGERVVEIPIIWSFVKKYSGKRILEIGSVLSHYFPINHDMVDKYEKGKRVINGDVVDFYSSEAYDLIISISTLEHVGWDEHPREPLKILKAIKNLKNLLALKGILVITLPLGYNPYLDKLLKERKINFTKLYCLKRISANNEWMQVEWKDIVNARYDDPFPFANGLVIGIIEK